MTRITPRTHWIFVEVCTRSGLRGYGEATLSGQEEAVFASLAKLSSCVLACPDATPSCLPVGDTLARLPDAAAFSSLDQALWDIEGQRRGISIGQALGGIGRDRILLYANVNRRTADRSPAGFAASALDAVAAGFSAIKIAPFDEVGNGDPKQGQSLSAIEPGLARISTVRAAVGANCRLMIDCHWRMNERTAQAAIAAVAQYGVHWVECPLPETPDHLPALRRLRTLANRKGIRLAGCEENIRRDGFAPFLNAGAYDVMMPDAKYVGGLKEMLSLSRIFSEHGVEFSPHNPTGPICHAASLHVCAAANSLDVLEIQFDESPWFDRLQKFPLPPAGCGMASVPVQPGLGTELDQSALDQCRVKRWSAA